MGATGLERFLPKTQHTQRKLLNFEDWIFQKKFSKIRVLKIIFFPPIHLTNENEILVVFQCKK